MLTPTDRAYLQDARAEYEQRLTEPDRAAHDVLLSHRWARIRIEELDRVLGDRDADGDSLTDR